MIKITNIGGLLLLLYLWKNYNLWSISINESNILSTFVVSLIQNLPSILITLLFIVGVSLYLRSLFTNKRAILMYMITISLFNILLKISMSVLMFKDTTTFFLCNVHNPVPPQWKVLYFQEFIDELVKDSPSILSNGYTLQDLQAYLSKNVNYEYLYTLNIDQINSYSREILGEAKKQYVLQWRMPESIKIIVLCCIMMKILLYINNFFLI